MIDDIIEKDDLFSLFAVRIVLLGDRHTKKQIHCRVVNSGY